MTATQAVTKNSPEQTALGKFDELVKIIQASKRLLIVSHQNPDGDAVGSSLAFASYLRSLGKEVVILSEYTVPQAYSFLVGSEAIQPVEQHDSAAVFDTVIALECPKIDRMGPVSKIITGKEKLISIDHHLGSEEYGIVNWIDPEFSSVGEMLWFYFKSISFKFDAAVAEQLYTAVMTDTGRFRFNNTKPRTMLCASELIAAGAEPYKISTLIYHSMEPSAVKLRGAVLGGIEFYESDKICVLTLTNKMLEDASADPSATEGLIDHTLFSKTSMIGVMIKEVDATRTRASLRSKEIINVADIAGQYGGGGHFHAAGLDIPLGLNDAKVELIDRLKKVVNEY